MHFIAAQGFSKISMMTVVIGAVTNIVLDPIFYFLDFHMGVAGSRSGNGALSGNQRSLGNPLPFWKRYGAEIEKKRISEFEKM